MDIPILLFTAFLVFAAVGFLKRLVLLSIMHRNLEFLNRYISIYNEFVVSYDTSFDSLLYLWLINKAHKAQGILSCFSADSHIPFIKPIAVNPQLLSRTLSAMKKGTAHTSSVSSSYYLLICCRKSMEGLIESLYSDMRKPLKLSLSGILYFVSLPVMIMYWFNMINDPTFYRIISSYELRLANLLISMICIITSAITILSFFSAEIL